MEKLTIPVIFENEHIVVFNKPVGLMVHADGRSTEYTLADYVGEYYPGAREVGEPLILEKGMPGETVVHRPGIVHRLDRDTSGVIVVAKDQPTFLHLKRQFKEHTTRKVYQALVYGYIQNDTGLIDAAIGRSKSDFRTRTVEDLHINDSRGTMREAVTRYKVLGRFQKEWEGKLAPVTYVEVYPLTGRTHQIRTHFKSIRHPLLGDDLYGPTRKIHTHPFGAERTMLHARRLTCELYGEGEVTFEAPLPTDFSDILAKIA